MGQKAVSDQIVAMARDRVEQVRHKDELLLAAIAEAEQILSDARLSSTEGRPVTRSIAEAEQILAEARAEAGAMRVEADAYAAEILRFLEEVLDANLAQIRPGLLRLSPGTTAPTQDPSAATSQLAELERANMLRVFDGWQELLARSIAGPELQQRLGISRQRLGQLRREGRLLGLRVPIRRELHYPVWQFGADGQPLAVLSRLLAAAREARLDPHDLDALMVNPRAGEGRALIDHLREGDEEFVLGVIRAAGE